MATLIASPDFKKLQELLGLKLGENCTPTRRMESFLTRDNWRILISGWEHGKQGWSRGFTVGDNIGNKGYVGPSHDGGRYEGRGWHQRMADDIVATVESLRTRVQVSGSPA